MPPTIEEQFSKITIMKLQKKYDQIPWPEILNILASPKKLTIEDEITVQCTECLTELNTLLKTTQKR